MDRVSGGDARTKGAKWIPVLNSYYCRPDGGVQQKAWTFMSKYISLANTLSIVLVTIGLAAYLLVSSAWDFQERAMLYSYLDLVRNTVEQVDSRFASSAVPKESEVCAAFERDGNSCRDPSSDRQKSTENKSSNTSDLNVDRPIDDIRIFDVFREEGIQSTSVQLAIFRLPIQTSEGARKLASRILLHSHNAGNDNNAEILEKFQAVYYIKPVVPGDGWPFIVGLYRDSGSGAIMVFDGWSSLWFMRGEGHGWGGVSEPSMEDLSWMKYLPFREQIEIWFFGAAWMQISPNRINQQTLLDAATLTGRTFLPNQMREARQVVKSPQENNLKVTGLPDSPRLLALTLPIFYFYVALLFRSSVRTIRTRGIDVSEPWLLLTPQTRVERIAVVAWSIALIASGVVVFLAFSAYESQTNFHLLSFRAAISDDSTSAMKAQWVRETYNGARDSGDEYVTRFPFVGIAVFVLCFVGMSLLLAAVYDIARMNTAGWARNLYLRQVAVDLRVGKRAYKNIARRWLLIGQAIKRPINNVLSQPNAKRFWHIFFFLSIIGGVLWVVSIQDNRMKVVIGLFLSISLVGAFGYSYQKKIMSPVFWKPFFVIQILIYATEFLKSIDFSNSKLRDMYVSAILSRNHAALRLIDSLKLGQCYFYFLVFLLLAIYLLCQYRYAYHGLSRNNRWSSHDEIKDKQRKPIFLLTISIFFIGSALLSIYTYTLVLLGIVDSLPYDPEKHAATIYVIIIAEGASILFAGARLFRLQASGIQVIYLAVMISAIKFFALAFEQTRVDKILFLAVLTSFGVNALFYVGVLFYLRRLEAKNVLS